MEKIRLQDMRHFGKQRASRPQDWLSFQRSIALVGAMAGMVFLVASLKAQSKGPTEYEVKSAYLYNFGKFVRWPNGTTPEAFTICVLGQDPFGSALDNAVARETLEGKKILVQRIAGSEEAGNCRILFISASEESRLKEILADLKKKPVLTVSEIANFARHGGMIQFVEQDNRIRFEVNLAASEAAGLAVSSELLKVAVAVRRNLPGGA